MKKAIIITGGTSGLGFEISKQLYMLNYSIITVSRNENKANKLKENLLRTDTTEDNKRENDFCYYRGDVSDESFVNAFMEDVCKKYEVTTLINNAFEGFFALPADIHSEDIEKCLKGVKGTMLTSAALLREWQAREMITNDDSISSQKNAQSGKSLRIINILSTAALKGKKMEAAYCMSKFAQRGYTEALKDAYFETNLIVNGVYLGGMNTDLWIDSRDYITEEKQKTFMNPQEVAQKIIKAYFLHESSEDLHINRSK